MDKLYFMICLNHLVNRFHNDPFERIDSFPSELGGSSRVFLLIFFLWVCEWGGCALREGGSPMHQSAAFISSFKELFVSITRFFHRHIGCSKASPCYFSSPFLLRRAVDRSEHRERCFCFDDHRASVFSAHAASLPLRPSLWIALTQEGTLCNSCGVLFST